MITKNTVAKFLLAFLFTVFFAVGSSTANAKPCDDEGFHEFNCPFIVNPGSEDGVDDDDDVDEGESAPAPTEGRTYLPYPGQDSDSDEDDTPRRR